MARSRTGSLALWVALAAMVAGLGWKQAEAAPRKRYDLKKVLAMSDRAKAKLPPSVLRRAVHKYGLKAVALRRSFLKKHNTCYKVTVPKPKNYQVRDQQYSGNCWIFASGRVLASKMHKKGKKAPMLSPSFVNYYNMRQTANALLREAARAGNKKQRPDFKRVEEADEGGFQIWAMKIIQRHGFVPERSMPMSADAADPALYVNRLQTLLVKAQGDLARVKGRGAPAKRKAMLKKYQGQVDALLDTAIGKPPKRFTYQGKRYTPRTFASKFLGLKPQDTDYVTLTHYTDRSFNRRYRSGKAPGMNSFDEYNVSMSTIQKAVKRSVRRGEAVLFGINVSEDHPHRAYGENLPRAAKGLLSIKAFDYGKLIPSPNISKRDKLRAGLWQANHAMTITGYDPGRKGVIKWKVENSHGRGSGDKGFFHMYDDYFKRHVEDVVVPRSAVPAHILKRADAQPRARARKRATSAGPVPAM